ncbi:MAG: cold shock domain-containing protein [Bifidobacteriaceae bacterium]|nr:cold shock domain-containing protein [Bifidobacteriaceae bacterium]
MPTGKIRFFDEGRGFGFITGEDGADVFLHVSALPPGAEAPRPGAKVEYDMAETKRGPSALRVQLLSNPPSVTKTHRKKPEDMVVIIEDVIKLLDETSNTLRRGRYPDRRSAGKVAQVLRAVAGDLDA